MAISMFFYALCEAIEKYLTANYEPSLIIFFRSSVGMVFVAWVTLTQGLSAYNQEVKLNIIRNFLAAVALFLSIYSLRNLPLSSYEFISLMAPILVVLLSAGFLKEKLSPSTFTSFSFSLGGALVMAYPFANESLDLGLAFAFLATLFNASASVATKRLAHLNYSLLYATYILTCFIMSGIFSYGNIHLNLAEIPLFFLIAGVHFIAFQSLVLAFRKEDLVKLAPLEYTLAVWAIVLGYFMWSYVPTLKELTGGFLIIVGSIVVRRKELTSFIQKGFSKRFRNRTIVPNP
jgi:drug/metabolite transporter (DMT)-like permease